MGTSSVLSITPHMHEFLTHLSGDGILSLPISSVVSYVADSVANELGIDVIFSQIGVPKTPQYQTL
jgi:phosphoserine phosphatase